MQIVFLGIRRTTKQTVSASGGQNEAGCRRAKNGQDQPEAARVDKERPEVIDQPGTAGMRRMGQEESGLDYTSYAKRVV